MPVTGRIMAIDLGDVRLGIAVSDRLGISANPHSSLNRANDKKTSAELVELAKREDIHVIVFGLPLEMSGEVGDQAKKVLAFVEAVKNKLLENESTKSIAVQTWDERLTSVQAERVLDGSGLKNKNRREARDRIAATLILEGYLSSIR